MASSALEDINLTLEELKKSDVYELINQAHHYTLVGHKGFIDSLSLSSDNSLLASSGDRTIRIWDLKARQVVHCFEGHSGIIRSVSFSGDNKYLCSGSDDKSIRIWNTFTKTEVKSIEIHSKSVKSVNFSADGKYIVSGSADKSIKIWSVLDNCETLTLQGHRLTVNSVCFSSDREFIVSGSDDWTVRLWSVSEKEEVFCYEGHKNFVKQVVFDFSTKLIASASADLSVRLWSVTEKCEEAVLIGHSSCVDSVSFSKDGRYLASGSFDSIVIVWNVVEKREEMCLYGHQAQLGPVVFSSDGSFVVSGSEDKTIKVWDLTQKTEEICFKNNIRKVFCVCVSADGKLIASGSEENSIKIWSTIKKTQEVNLEGHAGSVWAVEFNNNCEVLASGSTDKTIKIWNVLEHKEISTLNGHQYTVCSLKFCQVSKRLVSASLDLTIKIWNVEEGNEEKCFTGHTDRINSVKFNSLGDKILSGAEDKTIRIWDVEAVKEETCFTNERKVFSVDYNSDETFVASGGDDNVVSIWNIAAKRKEFQLVGHTNRVCSVVFSKNGRFIVSGSSDSTIRVWNYLEKRQEMCLQGHSSMVSSLSLTADSQTLISGSWDQTVRVWQISNPSLFPLSSPINENSSQVFPEPQKSLNPPEPSLTEHLADPKYQSILTYCNALSMINQSDYFKISDYCTLIGKQNFTPIHFAAFMGETESIEKGFNASNSFRILADAYGNSPVFYSIERKHQTTTDVLLKCITMIGRNKPLTEVIECMHAIRNELGMIIRNSSRNLCDFLSVCLHSRDLKPQFMAVGKERVRLIASVNSSFEDFQPNEYGVKEPLKIKASLIEIPAVIGSTDSLSLLASFLSTREKDLYNSQLITSFIKYRWNKLKPWILLYTALLWSNMILIIISFSTDHTTKLVCGILLLIINFALFLWEGFQFLAGRRIYLLNYWNQLDLARLFVTVAWVVSRLSSYESKGFDWAVVLINSAHGITGFRAFDTTRYYIQLILQSLLKISSFLIIFFYTTVAFGLLNTVGSDAPMISFISLWIDSFGLVFGETGNMVSNDFDIIYVTFFMAAIINVILMLNMIIALLGDSFDEFQVLANYYDNREMAEVVLEIEQMFSLFHPRSEKKFLHICENFYEEDSDLWQGKVVDMRMLIQNSIEESSRITGEVKRKIDEIGNGIKRELAELKSRGSVGKGSNGGDIEVSDVLKKSEARVFEAMKEMERRVNENLTAREKWMFEGIRSVGDRICEKVEESLRKKSMDRVEEVERKIEVVERELSGKMDRILAIMGK